MADPHDEDPTGRGGRFRRIGRRILGDPPEEGRSILGEAREMMGAVIEGSDKAKSEVVRAVAREVRNYLEELGLKDDVHSLLTNYSLEIHASVNLRRLAEEEKEPRPVKKPEPSRARREPPPPAEDEAAAPTADTEEEGG